VQDRALKVNVYARDSGIMCKKFADNVFLGKHHVKFGNVVHFLHIFSDKNVLPPKLAELLCQCLILVLCEYSKFRIESNSYFSIRFDLKFQIVAQLFDLIRNEKKTIRTALLNLHREECGIL